MVIIISRICTTKNSNHNYCKVSYLLYDLENVTNYLKKRAIFLLSNFNSKKGKINLFHYFQY